MFSIYLMAKIKSKLDIESYKLEIKIKDCQLELKEKLKDESNK